MRQPALLRSVLAASSMALLPSLAGAAAGPWHDDGPVAIRLLSPWQVAPRGGELALGLEAALDPEWHIYWLNSGDAGYPPRLDVAATPGATGVELRFAVPHRYELPGDLVAFGYGGQVVYPLTLRGNFAGTSPLAVAMTVDYVVCASSCIPFTSRLSLAQPLGDAPRADAATQRLLATWEARVPAAAPPGTAVARAFDLTHGGGALELALTGLPLAASDLFFAPHELVELGRPIQRRDGERDLFTLPFSWKVRRDPPPVALELDWTAALGDAGWTGRVSAALDPASTAPPVAAAPPRPSDAAGRELRWPWAVVLAAALLGLAWALWPRSGTRSRT